MPRKRGRAPAGAGEGALEAVVLDVVDVLQDEDGRQRLCHSQTHGKGPKQRPHRC